MGTKRLSGLDEQEKQRLCSWYARSWLWGVPRPGAGYECQNGYRASGRELNACVEAFPSCELSVDEVEDCMRRQRVDLCYAAPESASCIPKRACLWGMADAPAAK